MGETMHYLEDNSLKATDTGYEFQIHLMWYRSLPLSCIEKINLTLDRQLVDPKVIKFGINGHQYRLDELADLVEEFWFVQDLASLIVNQPDSVTPGSAHKINVELSMRYPYIAIGPGKFLTNINKYSANQVAG
jgi:hypothetical protein